MKEDKTRNQRICKHLLQVLNYRKTAEKFGISRQRVFQIWFKNNDKSPKETALKSIKNK